MSTAKRILIIDDEVDLQQMIKLTLRSKGYEIDTASDGLEGLAKLKPFNPDLIILDMNMPKMGGLDFYKAICDANGKPRFPILVLTARANMEKLFKELNIDGFMAKPFEIDDLLHDVDAILKKASGVVKTTPAGVRAPRKVCIVENDPIELNNIGSAFLAAGYMVNPAQNGTEGIERTSNTLPDVVLIKLALTDITGDMVILKLRNMAKTQHMKCILYSNKSAERTLIKQLIGEKQGVDVFIDYIDPKDLVEAAEAIFKT